MTARLPFTKASMRKRIAAAQEMGLRVTGIAPDGTVQVENRRKPVQSPDGHVQTAPSSEGWEDVEA
jgi:hypothetical protein